jgi:hypothetical protein
MSTVGFVRCTNLQSVVQVESRKGLIHLKIVSPRLEASILVGVVFQSYANLTVYYQATEGNCFVFADFPR